MEERQDLISRQVAIDALRDAENHAFNSFYKGLAKAHKIIADLPSVQPDHNADVSKKVDMMHEYIYKIVKDCDGVYCYINRGEIIRCGDCKHYKPISSSLGQCYVHSSRTEKYRMCQYCDYCSWAERKQND